MERRVFVAILLSFVVLYGYQALFPPPAQQSSSTGSTPASQPQEAPITSDAPVGSGTIQPDVEPPAAIEFEALTTEGAEREIVVDTAQVQAVLSNRGARVLRWRLKEYKDGKGEPLDLVPTGVPAEQPRPLSLVVDDAAVTRRLNNALYRVSGDVGGHVDATAKPATLVFEFQDAAGLRARKELTFESRGYVLGVAATVNDGAQSLNPAIAWGPGLGDAGAVAGGGSFLTGNYTQPPEAIYHRDGDVERVTGTSLAEQPVHEGKFRFVGVDDHYFVVAAIDPGEARVRYELVTLPGANDTQRLLVAQSIRVAEPLRVVRFFIGPKQFDALQPVDPELTRAINFGMFRVLSVPLLTALKWVYGFVGNYGWAIIILTILINLAVAPLRHKSVVSMRKMQALQPQLKAIQDHYSGLKVSDPARQKMNTEIMNLYRERGVNPASGCIPMVLMMPILFAFYSLLSQSIELRGAEFGLWIRDLSEHDPYYVTPVLMAATMFWQQWITPTASDPAQQKIMMLMPLMFGVMFLWVPSGLVIYWFVGNLWAIGQQYFTNWLIGPPAAATVRPPAERRMKNAGSGHSAGARKD